MRLGNTPTPWLSRYPFPCPALGAAPAITSNFTVAQTAGALFGFIDATATHSAIPSNDWNNLDTGMAVYITGSSATMNIYQALAGGFNFSVDDGAFQVTTGGAGFQDVTIFTGLSDSQHLVRVVSSAGYNSGGAATRKSGNLFSVTGAAPAVSIIGTGVHVTDPSLVGQHLSETDNTPGGAITPTFRRVSYLFPNTGGNSNYSRNGITKIRAQTSEIWVFTGDPAGHYAIDNGAQVTTVFPAGIGERRCWRRLATGLDAGTQHTYTITNGRTAASPSTDVPVQGVMIPSAGAYGTYTAQKTALQFGDSITEGANGASTIYTGTLDILVGSAAVGFCGLPCGKGGAVAATLDTAMDSIYDGNGHFPVGDVAILAIGRNDTSGAAFRASYDSIIGKLLAAGWPKVLCRGITPDQAGTFLLTLDTDIQTVVTARANVNVIFISSATWTNIGTNESPPFSGTHPTDAGYITMAGYENSMYTTYLL